MLTRVRDLSMQASNGMIWKVSQSGPALTDNRGWVTINFLFSDGVATFYQALDDETEPCLKA